MFSLRRKKSEQGLDPHLIQPTPEEIAEAESGSKRAQFTSFLKKGWEKGVEMSTEEAGKARIYVEKSLGLGAQPSVIPPGEAGVAGDLRTVELGWHPVPGAKWFAEGSLGGWITKEVGKYPDPTQHWAVLIGDYCHQLWMDEKLDVIYINAKIDRGEWHTFSVGKTRFNDQALKQASDMTIHNMRAKRPAYNLISNNCQNFAVNLLDSILTGAHREFATTFSIYQRATGKGAIKDLFSEPPPPEENAPVQAHQTHENTMQYAQQVMDENTTQLDHHHQPVH